MTIRSIRLSLAALALCGCASQQVRDPGGAGNDLATATMTVRVDSTMPAVVARAMAAADSATRSGAARLGRVDVHPDSLTLGVGARYPLASLAVAFRDSSGAPIAGMVPHYWVSAPVARITVAFELEGIEPGQAEVRVGAMTSRGAPRPDVPPAVVRVTVIP